MMRTGPRNVSRDSRRNSAAAGARQSELMSGRIHAARTRKALQIIGGAQCSSAGRYPLGGAILRERPVGIRREQPLQRGRVCHQWHLRLALTTSTRRRHRRRRASVRRRRFYRRPSSPETEMNLEESGVAAVELTSARAVRRSGASAHRGIAFNKGSKASRRAARRYRHRSRWFGYHLRLRHALTPFQHRLACDRRCRKSWGLRFPSKRRTTIEAIS